MTVGKLMYALCSITHTDATSHNRILLECRTVRRKLREHLTTKSKSNSVTQFSQISNEWLKSDVFSHRLKTDSDGDAVTSDGRLFQTRAAATAKARSPTVTRRVGGMFSSNVEAERSRRCESMSATRRSSHARYGGAISCKQRKASTASLNSIRCGTRNQ